MSNCAHVAVAGYGLHGDLHDDAFARRKQRRNRTTFTLQQVRGAILHTFELELSSIHYPFC